MKIRHDALLAVAVMGVISAHAQADSFRDALTGGKVSGEVRNTYAVSSYSYSSAEAGALNNNNVLGSALALDYVTGDFKGFKVGVGFQAGRDWGIQDEDTGLSLAGGEEDHRIGVDSTNLYRAYLEYRFDKSVTDTGVRIGRQKIVSPLLMNSGAFPMQDAFDALVIENKDLPDTSLRFMYVDQWVMRYGDDASGSVTQTDKQYDDPVYSFYLKNSSLQGLDIEAQWLANDNDTPAGDPPTAAVTADAYDAGFLGLTYSVPDSSWVLGAKMLTADYEKRPDTGYWGIKAKTTVAGVGVQLSYTSVEDDANFPGTLGHVPMFRSYYTGYSHEIFAGLETTSLDIDYGFGVPGLKVGFMYADWKQSADGIANSGKDFDGGFETGVDVRYQFQDVKGLSARVKTSYMDFDQQGVEDDDLTYTRVTLNYKF